MIVELILFITAFYLLLLYTNRKPKDLPPGSWGPPIIGLLPRGRKHYVSLLKDYEENYGGGIYCSNIGSRIAVFITDPEILHQALSRLEFSGRPNFFTVHTFGDGLGISMAQGKIWQVNRRFAIRNLRDYGFGKSIMEPIILNEAEFLMKDFDKRLGKPTKIKWALNVAMLNIIWSLIADTRFDLDDKKVIQFSQLSIENFQILQGKIAFLDFYGWTKYLPDYLKHTFFNAGDLVKNKENFKTFLMEYILKQEKKLDVNNPRNFIESYLVDAMENKDPELDFKSNMKNLVNVLINFFTGSESTSTSFRWFINCMAMNLDVQEKIQKQIDEFVPRDRLPTLEDREKLSYMEAAVYEASRLGSVVIFAIPHSTMKEVEIEGYKIPKGAVVFPCVEKCHYDKKVWKHPDSFHLEHFLDDNGKFNSQAGFVAFSTGKRICPGKDLAIVSMFLFAASILQRYTIRPADGVKMTYASEESSPFISFPISYDLVIEKRK